MKYTVTFAMIGILLTYLAVSLSGAFYFLTWPAVSFFILSAGYAGPRRNVFFKRPDGKIPLWAKALNLPYLLYLTAVWHGVRILSRENPFDRISADILIGRRLRAFEVPEGIVNYVDLTFELEDPETLRSSLNYISLPVLDAGVPEVRALRSAIAKLVDGPTFIHCAQGHGRTGLFTLALLAGRGRIGSLEEGLALLKKARPGLDLNREQKNFIAGYIDGLARETGRNRGDR